MRESTHTKKELLKVGLLVIVTLVILSAAIIVLVGGRLFSAFDTYTMVFEGSVSGLTPGANVSYTGVSVGRVSDISLDPEDPSKVLVRVDLRKRTPIKVDTTAALYGSMVTGIKYIELEGGSPDSACLLPGKVISTKISFEEEVTLTIQGLLDDLRGMFQKENQDNFNSLVRSFSNISNKFDNTLESLQKYKGQVITQLATTFADIRRLIETIRAMMLRVDRFLKLMEHQPSSIVWGKKPGKRQE